jgi:competence protein ComEC
MGRGVDAMLWTAERVAALPGAILHLPAMPTAALLLMIAGGLWLALWQTRWRLAAGGRGAHRGRPRAGAYAAAA